jgi:hypothetical protein
VNVTLSGLDRTLHALYGAHACRVYAQYKYPPKAATQNVDSYAWMASDKFFAGKWGQTFRIISARDSGEDDSLFDVGFGKEAAEDICLTANQPETADCALMDKPRSFNFVSLDAAYPCYSNGNRNRCDIHTFDTCQATIGWNTSNRKPNVSFDDLNAAIQRGLNGKGDCAAAVQDETGLCAIGSNVCAKGNKFCLKRTCVDCR